MQRYRHAQRLFLGLGALLTVAACSVPSQRQNVAATAALIANQVPAPLEWRLDEKSDAEARQRAQALLADGLTLQEAVAVSFLASPDLQVALEKLEISRAELVAAVTPPNPVALVGTRQVGGDLAAFYPDRSISFGVLENVIGLLNLPDRRAVARRDLERARFEAASTAVRHAALVAQDWLDYAAALQAQDLHERSLAVVRVAYDNMTAGQAAGAGFPPQQLAAQRTSLLDEQSGVIRAKLASLKARAELGQQLGISGWRDDWALQGALPPLPANDPDPAAVEQAALDRRLDLQAATKTVDARLKVLSMQRHFRWLNQLDLGLFRDKVVDGASFTGPNAVIEVPLFDQRQSELLKDDALLRTEVRQLAAARLAARTEIRNDAAEMSAARQLLEQLDRDVQPGLLRQQADPAGGNPDDAVRLNLRLAAINTEATRIDLLHQYWRARSALALAAGDWAGLSALR